MNVIVDNSSVNQSLFVAVEVFISLTGIWDPRSNTHKSAECVTCVMTDCADIWSDHKYRNKVKAC